MLKQFLGSLALVTVLAESALANSVPLGSKYPEVPNGSQEALLCYIQTPDGRTLDLHDLCVKPTEKDEEGLASGPQAVNSSDNSSGSNFAANSSCFLVDDNGRPCPSSD